MSDQPLLLVVDDEPFNLEILEEVLGQLYQLEYAESGKECLEKLHSITPDLILMDVNMPEMTGIETCIEIKQNLETADVPVIFVSALGRIEERMNGYKAGGEDYIIKPFDDDELLTKVQLILCVRQEKKALQQGSNDAMNMAMTAMTQASEMGEVMQFTRDSYHCNSLDTLAKRLLESLAQIELTAILRLTGGKQDFFFSSSGTVRDSVQEAMEHVREKERFIHFGKRTVINFDHISVLIQNMPIENEEKYGRLNDILGMLIEGADARIVGIEMSSSLISLIDKTREVLADIKIAHKANEKKNTMILDDLSSSIDWAFINMDLSEQQEDYFKELIKHATEQSSSLFNADMQLEQKIKNLIDSLSINT